jgi:excinuclease ABC subunit C
MVPLDQALEFDPGRDEEFFEALPAQPAVYRIELHAAGAFPYLRRTADLRRSCRRVLGLPAVAGLPDTTPASAESAAPTPAETGSGQAQPGLPALAGRRPRLNLRDVAARVRYRLTGSAFEQSLAIYQQARELYPRRYRERLRLGPPALLKINFANDYPRCYVARRLLSDGAFYFGPFPSCRAAEGFSKEFLPLFKIRRCHIKIRRDPAFPGCIYSEMKMCLAPCFAGCTKPEYDAEAARTRDFLASRGASLVAEIETQRESAAATQDFERAAAVHKKFEKVAAVVKRLPDLPRPIDRLDAVILQPAAAPGSVAAFRVGGGAIADPFLVNFTELSSMPRSVESILKEYMEGEHPRADAASLADHLSLLARWFYSKPRQGEIFFREGAPGGGWPYRRIIRACARVLGTQALLPPAKA